MKTQSAKVMQNWARICVNRHAFHKMESVGRAVTDKMPTAQELGRSIPSDRASPYATHPVKQAVRSEMLK